MDNKEYIKYYTVGNRTFKVIIGWLEYFPWTYIYELHRKKKHIFDFGYQTLIDDYLREDDGIEEAENKITTFLEEQKEEAERTKKLEKWADIIL